MAELDLAKNTIYDFHNDLMRYYKLCEIKQQNHAGDWVTGVDQIPVPLVHIGQDVLQDRTILRDRDWGTKHEWRDYMLSKGYNKENTKMYFVDHDNLPKKLLNTLKTLPIRYPVFSLNVQPPGSVVPAHEDTWRIWYDKFPDKAKKYTFEDTVFFIVFLSVQEIGHSFTAGTNNVKWAKGSVIKMPYYCKHATSNAGFENKILVQCLGIKK